MGYSTTVPSAWKLTQLFGKTASGLRGESASSATQTFTPSAASAFGEGVEFGARLRGGVFGGTGLLKTIGDRGLGIEAEVPRTDHEHSLGALHDALRPEHFSALHRTSSTSRTW